jgi:hypothetical protein
VYKARLPADAGRDYDSQQQEPTREWRRKPLKSLKMDSGKTSAGSLSRIKEGQAVAKLGEVAQKSS